MNTPDNHAANPALKTIRAGYPGTPTDGKSRFVNEEFPFVPKLKDVLKWMTGPKPQRHEKRTDTWRPGVRHDASFLQQADDCIVWLGHASFFIRIGGKRLLIDPVFFNVPFVKRLSPAPFPPEIFTGLDYLLLSHDHQDHCQEKSVRAVMAANPGLPVITGLNMTSLLRPWVGSSIIHEAGWYQQYDTGDEFRITYLPTRHWGRRSLSDTNKRLWGAFMLQGGGRCIYFGGDSGYGSHFREAATLFPKIDVAILGAGAFRPEWFMGPSHMSPASAVDAFADLKADVMIPMHYGTFDLSDEAIGEPLRRLQAMDAAGKIPRTLRAMDVGEVMGV